MLGQWTIELQTFRDHVTELILKDETGAPLNIAGWFFKFEVVNALGTLLWSTVTGHAAISAPATNGKVVLTVPQAEIAAFSFEWANFSFYAGPDSPHADLIYQGKVRRI